MEYVCILIVLVVIIVLYFLYQNGYLKIRKIQEVKENQIKIACVGDSITYGFGVKNWSENNYPKLLQDMLGDKYHVANFGFSGSCIGKFTDFPYMKTNQYLKSLEYDPDILIFMLGSNDSKPFNWAGKEQFKEEYLTLLDTYIKEKAIKVYLCTVSRAFFRGKRISGMTNYGIQPKIIEEIVEVIKEVASEKEYELIDINKLTFDNRIWFIKDNVHPNNEGIKAIAKEIYEKINNKLYNIIDI